MSESKEGILLNFQEETNSLAATLTAYIKKAPGTKGSLEEQRNLIKDIISITGIDEGEWRVKSFKLTPNIWGVTMKQKKYDASSKVRDTGTTKEIVEGQKKSKTKTTQKNLHKDYEAHAESWAEQAQNYQLKIEIFFERIAPPNRNEFKEQVIEDIKRLSRRAKVRQHKVNGEYLLLVDIPDHHLGRLSWGAETGDSYDIKIAEKRFIDCVAFFKDEVRHIMKKHPIAKIIFIIGNDYFNYDYPKPFPMTSNQTHQESDIRYQKMFSIGSGLVIGQIESMSEIAPVEVWIVPGNHDEFTSYFLGEILDARFHSNPNITVINTPKKRKYLTWGKNMLGFGHHQYESFERMFANMALEEQKLWSNARHKYFYTGHKHHKEVMAKLIHNKTITINTEVQVPKKPILITEDLNGVLFDRLASLTSNDYYETTRGYIHMKGAEAHMFHKEFGKRITLNYQLPLSIHNK